jgi:hypothetical protein
MKKFHIFTIANNLGQYSKMKSSFLTAGFDETRCRYSLFDNSKKNIFDPYTEFNHIRQTTVEPYIIFCHQDLLLNQGHGFEELIKCLENLDKNHPRWAIAGNAGKNKYFKMVARITDPNNTPNWNGSFPQQVYSLDENFLVIKTSAKVSCSTELEGFHFYGSDLCLNAIKEGYSCYVIDFHLTHLSGGTFDQEFWKIQSKFYDKWCNKFSFSYFMTATGILMVFSKTKIIRTVGSKDRVKNWVFSKQYVLPLFQPNFWKTLFLYL